MSCGFWDDSPPGYLLPHSKTLEEWKELLSVGLLSWDISLPRLGREPGDIDQATAREVIEVASVSLLWVTGLITNSTHHFCLLCDLL